MGGRAPVLADRQTWRSVQWCRGRPLAGFSVVAGDPSVAVLAVPDAYVLAVTIFGQDFSPCCRAEREPDEWWDAETKPLHPWAGAVLPTRADVRSRWDCEGRAVCVSLSPSWAPALLGALVSQATVGSVLHVVSHDPIELLGADLAVVSAATPGRSGKRPDSTRCR